MWKDPIVIGLTSGFVMLLVQSIKPLECLMYSVVVKLLHHGEMDEIDHSELACEE